MRGFVRLARFIFSIFVWAIVINLGMWVEDLALQEDHVISAADSVRSQPDHCLVDQSVLQDVRAQKEDLKKREAELETKQKELAEQKRAVEEEMAKLKEYRDSINLMSAQNDAKLEEQTAKLMDTLEKMSPKKAAQIINDVNDRLAVAALSRVPTQKLSKIMNSMAPARAAQLAQLMTSQDWLKQPKSASPTPSNDGAQSQPKGGE